LDLRFQPAGIEFPGLEIHPLEADYEEVWDVPQSKRKSRRTVAFFPGSTIGNFEPAAAVAFLRKVALLCGTDGGGTRLETANTASEDFLAALLAIAAQGLFSILDRFLVPRGLRLRPA
jgi:hypothetical protein